MSESNTNYTKNSSETNTDKTTRENKIHLADLKAENTDGIEQTSYLSEHYKGPLLTDLRKGRALRQNLQSTESTHNNKSDAFSYSDLIL